jgi:hypothetical protein
MIPLQSSDLQKDVNQIVVISTILILSKTLRLCNCLGTTFLSFLFATTDNCVPPESHFLSNPKKMCVSTIEAGLTASCTEPESAS